MGALLLYIVRLGEVSLGQRPEGREPCKYWETEQVCSLEHLVSSRNNEQAGESCSRRGQNRKGVQIL